MPGADDRASELVRTEWRNRIAAEYTSAAICQHLVLWLIQAGAPPDLIDAGLVIVADELTHSRLAHEVYLAAGGEAAPAIDQDQLGLRASGDGLLVDILTSALLNFCLNETVAVPLFQHLRAGCTEPGARAALDRILRDEVRHRDFGWDLLDWLVQSPLGPQVPTLAEGLLPSMFGLMQQSYGVGNQVVAGDDGAMAMADRAWGLAPPRDYADILTRTFARDWAPRFAARGIGAAAAWARALTPAARRTDP